MAYGLKYYFEYDDIQGVHRGVEIYEKEYGGDSIAINSAQHPIVVKERQRGGRGDEDQIIIGREFMFSFMYPANVDIYAIDDNEDAAFASSEYAVINQAKIYDHLSESPYKKHYLKFLKNYDEVSQSTVFQGWLKPENITRELIEFRYKVTISAVDGLADLRDIEFKKPPTAGIYYYGDYYITDRSMMYFIRAALDKLNVTDRDFELPFRVVLNTYEEEQMSDTECVLFESTIDPEIFLNNDRSAVSAYEVLERILFNFNCKLKQINAQYWIINYNESAYAAANGINTYVYEIPWSLASASRTSINNYVELTGNNYEIGGEFSKLPIAGQIDLTYKNRYLGEKLDGDATGQNDSTNYCSWDNWVKYAMEGGTQYDYINVGTIDSEGTLTCLYNAGVNDYTVLLTKAGLNLSAQSDSDYFQIDLQHRLESIGNIYRIGIAPIYFYIEITKPSGSTYAVTSQKVYPKLDWKYYKSDPNYMFKIDEDGDYLIRIYIYENASVSGQWDYCYLQLKAPIIRQLGSTIQTYDRQYTIVNPDGFAKEKYETYIGDSINSYDLGKILIDNTLSSSWNRFNRTDELPLLYLTLLQKMNNRQSYSSIIRFTYIDENDVISLEKAHKIGDYYYEIIGLEKDYNSGKATVTAIRLYTDDYTSDYESYITSAYLLSTKGTSVQNPYNETSALPNTSYENDDIDSYLSGGTGINYNLGEISLYHLGIQNLSDPNSDRIMFWDDSGGSVEWLFANTGLSISGNSLNVSLASFDTGDLSEGTNLYFTTARVDDHLSGGTGIGYSAGSISIDNTVLQHSDVDNSPVNGEVDVPVSSNWAYDHENNSSAHHTKYALTDDLTSSEISQIQNIGGVTISNTQWGYLGAMGAQPWGSDNKFTAGDNLSWDGTTLDATGVLTSVSTLQQVTDQGNSTDNNIVISGTNNAPTTGSALELKYAAGSNYGLIYPYDRDGGNYQRLDIRGNPINLGQGNVNITDGVIQVDGTGDSYIMGNLGIKKNSPNATLHGTGSTILGANNTEIADADIGNGQVNIWVDETNHELEFKVKYSDGTVKSGVVSLGEGVYPLSVEI